MLLLESFSKTQLYIYNKSIQLSNNRATKQLPQLTNNLLEKTRQKTQKSFANITQRGGAYNSIK